MFYTVYDCRSSNGDSNIPAWKQALNIRRQQNGNRSSLFLLNDKQTDNDGNESIPAWKRELKEKKKRRESMELQVSLSGNLLGNWVSVVQSSTIFILILQSMNSSM